VPWTPPSQGAVDAPRKCKLYGYWWDANADLVSLDSQRVANLRLKLKILLAQEWCDAAPLRDR